MTLVTISAAPPQALRVLVQGSDDAAPIDFAISIASVFAEHHTRRRVLVINASGKDIGAFAKAFAPVELVEVRDAQGRPSRALTEIVDTMEKEVRPGEFAACVVLDANRLYRATRCSVRDLRSIENLSAGDWDNTNEALGAFCEVLTRLGLPTIFYAPPTDVYGVDDSGEPIVVGNKAQGWKDLPRSSHVHVVLSRRSRDLVLEVAGDDWGRLGKPGTEIVGTTAAWVGETLAPLARDSRPGQAAGTTLAESSASELAARTRRTEERNAASAQVRTRLLNIADLRAYQGRWDEYTQEISESVQTLTAEDLNAVTKRSSEVLARHEWSLAWQLHAARDLELSSRPLHELRGDKVAGPSIHESPARDDMPVERLLTMAREHAEHELRQACREDLCAWIASLAQYAGVWSEPAFAVVCNSIQAACAGPGWHCYHTDALRLVAVACLSLARTRHQYDPPSRPEPARLRAVVDEPTAPDVAVEAPSKVLQVQLPDVAEFARMHRGPAGDLLNTMITEWGWRDRVPELFAAAGVPPPSKPQDAHRWPPEVRVPVYQFLLDDRTQRLAS